MASFKFKNVYLNDYYTFANTPFINEKDFMKTDIRMQDKLYIIEVDLPGLKKEDINITYEQGYLTITASRNIELKTEVYVRRERFQGEIKRSFFLFSIILT